MNWPNEISGTHPLAGWCNKLLRAAKASRVHKGLGYDISHTTDGTILKLAAGGGGVTINPFTIYQSSTWLKFKVTTGYVIKTGDAIVPALVETEFTVNTGVGSAWLYIDLSDDTIKLTETTPTWTVDEIPIGWVDTSTYAAQTRSVIYQFLTTHVYNPCTT